MNKLNLNDKGETSPVIMDIITLMFIGVILAVMTSMILKVEESIQTPSSSILSILLIVLAPIVLVATLILGFLMIIASSGSLNSSSNKTNVSNTSITNKTTEEIKPPITITKEINTNSSKKNHNSYNFE